MKVRGITQSSIQAWMIGVSYDISHDVSHDLSHDVSHYLGVHPKLLEAFSLKPQPPVSTIVIVCTQTFKTSIFL